MSSFNYTIYSNSTLLTDYIIREASMAMIAIRLLGIWGLITCIIGTPFNLFTLYLTIHLINNYPSSNNRWFILSMTLADLLFTTLHSPISFVRYYLGYRLNSFWCKTYFIFTHTSTVASSLNLLWLNCDKFLYMNKPLHYHLIITKSRSIFLCIISGLISISWSLFFIFGPFNTWTERCVVSTVQEYAWLYIIFAVSFFVVPTFMSFLISIYVAVVVLRARNRDNREMKMNRREDDPNWVRSYPASKWKTITFVFTTTIWSVCTCLPYRIAYIMITMKVFPPPKGIYAIVYLSLLGLLATNAMGNPIITIITQNLYRMKIWQIFGFGRRRTRGEQNSNSRAGVDGSSSYSSVSIAQTARV